MKTDIHLRFLAVAAAAGLLAGSAPALATDIANFSFGGLECISDCSFDDRMQKSDWGSVHVVNIDDCKALQTRTLVVNWGLTSAPLATARWVVKLSKPDGSCSESSFTVSESGCQEELVVTETDFSSYSNLAFNVPFGRLLPAGCVEGTDATTTLYIVVQTLTDTFQSRSTKFDIDMKRPKAPELAEPLEGDRNLTIKWTDPDNDSETGIKYRVYFGQKKFDELTKGEVDRTDAKTDLSRQLNNLENNVEYWFAVAAVDASGNESPLSAVGSAMPVPVLDFFENYRKEGDPGADKGGFCFIATAAYGSGMADQVWTLRVFRDRFLLTWGPGRAFVATYYALSPPIADFIAGSGTLRAIVRGLLWPVVQVAGWAVELPPGWGFVVPVAGLLLAALAAAATMALARARRGS